MAGTLLSTRPRSNQPHPWDEEPSPLRGGSSGEVGLDLLEELFLRHVAHDALGLAPVLEEDHRRYRADPKATCRDRIGIDVELRDPDLLALLSGDLFEDGSDHATGATPGRPEIDQHGSVGFDDFRLEVLVAHHLWLGH